MGVIHTDIYDFIVLAFRSWLLQTRYLKWNRVPTATLPKARIFIIYFYSEIYAVFYKKSHPDVTEAEFKEIYKGLDKETLKVNLILLLSWESDLTMIFFMQKYETQSKQMKKSVTAGK